METFHISGQKLDDPILADCVTALRSGNILCYPTETFYALGIDPWNETGREKLFELKGRPSEKDLPMIAADLSMVARFCDVDDLRFQTLTKKFWPGPLTLVLYSRDHSKSHAIRVSSHPIARQLASALGKPIVSTSANFAGARAICDPALLPVSFQNRISILLEGGICAGGLPSTIVSLLETPGRILRQGAIPSSELLAGL